MFHRLWSSYNHRLQTHPYITNAITTGCVIGVGDSFAQYIEQYNKYRYNNNNNNNNDNNTLFVYNKTRGSIMFSWGLLGFGPFFTHWYRLFLPGRIGHKYSVPTRYNIVMKCIFTSIIAIPVNATFFVYATSIEHTVARYQEYTNQFIQHNILRQAHTTMQQQLQYNNNNNNSNNNDILYNELCNRFTNRFPTVITASWFYWFPLNYINWMYIPLQYRMVYSSIGL